MRGKVRPGSVATVAALALFLAGCGGGGSEEAPPAEARAEATASTLYVHDGSANADWLEGSATGRAALDAARRDRVNYSWSNAERGAWWSLDLARADGQPLRVGRHEGGVTLAGPGRGCDSPAGQYDVRELRTAADGSVTALAVDFVQVCGGASLAGSLRVGSSVPLAVN